MWDLGAIVGVQHCEMISGFYFGSLESLEEVLALCLSSARLVTFEPSANDFNVFFIKLLYMMMHFMCDMSCFLFYFFAVFSGEYPC